MLNIRGTRRSLCDGLARRDFLQVGGVGALGLSLGDSLALPSIAAAPAPLSRGGQAKSCIFIFLFGSPPSHETFDPKPAAPVEVQGEMKAIDTNVPGLQIGEGIPNLARVMDRTTVIRSMTHNYPIHGVGHALSGIPVYTAEIEGAANDPRHWPAIGSVVDYLESRRAPLAQGELPRNIGLPWLFSSKTDLPHINAGVFGAYLGRKHDPVWTDFDGKGLRIAPPSTVGQVARYYDPNGGCEESGRFRLTDGGELPEDVSLERLGLRRSLLAQFEQARSQFDTSPRAQTLDHHRQTAFSLLTSSRMRDALDIGRESRALREKYGMTLFGQACLAARRLVEAGAKFVTVYWDCFGQFGNGAWDTHQHHYPRLKELLLPGFNLAYPALIEDLSERGMLDETLVVCTSEHGRTPTLKMNKPGGGRDHWSRAYSTLLAGGGAARGKVVGRTTPDGGDVADTPVSPKDILATTYHLLGYDAHATVLDQQNRPHPLAGDGVVRPELLS